LIAKTFYLLQYSKLYLLYQELKLRAPRAVPTKPGEARCPHFVQRANGPESHREKDEEIWKMCELSTFLWITHKGKI
jgi:hypothetical protein